MLSFVIIVSVQWSIKDNLQNIYVFFIMILNLIN